MSMWSICKDLKGKGEDMPGSNLALQYPVLVSYAGDQSCDIKCTRQSGEDVLLVVGTGNWAGKTRAENVATS